MSEKLARRVGSWLAARPSRREFLVKSAVVGSALAVNPLRYVLRPGTAYGTIVGSTPPPRVCPPGSLCFADGYAEFCCTINGGVNSCPEGTIAGGWWVASGSVYCSGPRYYIDCVGVCTRCTTGCSTGWCPDCDAAPPCDCANGDCNNRRVGCREFRYGQCNQNITCVGRLACRVVSCTPAWQIEPSCSQSSASDDLTANHTSPCLAGAHPIVVGIAAGPGGGGYWVGAADGSVLAFGSARMQGLTPPAPRPLNHPVVSIAANPINPSYWLAASDGGVFAMGAPYDGSQGGAPLNSPVVGMAAASDGTGYWLAAADGGIFAFGGARFLGSLGVEHLVKPIVGIAAHPTGQGYWLVAADGGVFAFGAARYYGSLGGKPLVKPIKAIAAAPDGQGYWLAAEDGGVFAFGSARFAGSMSGQPLGAPIVGIAAHPSGQGYWLVGGDGGIFAFGGAGFFGSWP